MTPTANIYFAGAGLMDLGLTQGGVQVQESFEIEEDCCAVQRANFGHKVVSCDIRQKLVKDESPADIMVATFPCTKYSPIADVHGTRNGDDLFLHFLRHVAISLPEAYVVENVPGMKAFPVVMEALTALPYYYVHVECPVDALTWLPQRRKRLIILATRKHFTWRPPEAQTRVRLKDVVEQDPRVEIPDYVYTRLKEGYRSKSIVSDPEKDDVAPCCVAHYAKDRSTRLVADKRFPMGVRPYSVREWARLQGVPDTFKWPVIDRSAYRMIGNGVAVPLGRWVGQELCRYFNQG